MVGGGLNLRKTGTSICGGRGCLLAAATGADEDKRGAEFAVRFGGMALLHPAMAIFFFAICLYERLVFLRREEVQFIDGSDTRG